MAQSESAKGSQKGLEPGHVRMYLAPSPLTKLHEDGPPPSIVVNAAGMLHRANMSVKATCKNRKKKATDRSIENPFGFQIPKGHFLGITFNSPPPLSLGTA